MGGGGWPLRKEGSLEGEERFGGGGEGVAGTHR